MRRSLLNLEACLTAKTLLPMQGELSLSASSDDVWRCALCECSDVSDDSGQWILYQRAQRRRSDRPALIFAITSALGWRSAFFVLGGGGVLWFSVWVLSTASPKLEPVWHDDPREGDAPKEKLARIIVQIIRSPRFLPVLVVAVLINPCLYFSVNWLPTYFAQQHGLLPGSQLGWILTAIYLGVGVGNFLCGAGVLTLTRRGRPLAAASQAHSSYPKSAPSCARMNGAPASTQRSSGGSRNDTARTMNTSGSLTPLGLVPWSR